MEGLRPPSAERPHAGMVALYDPQREKWRRLAACRNAPGGAETFHPYGQKGALVALSYCARCPVIIECAA